MKEARVVIHRKGGRLHRCVVEQDDGTSIDVPIYNLEYEHPSGANMLGTVKLCLWSNHIKFEED